VFLLAPMGILLVYSFWHVTPSFAIERRRSRLSVSARRMLATAWPDGYRAG